MKADPTIKRNATRNAAPEQGERLLDLLVADTEQPSRIEGVVVGTLEGFDETGSPRVDFAMNARTNPVAARATVGLKSADKGREVALLFEQGDLQKPIVIGLMWEPENPSAKREGRGASSMQEERLTFTAEREIVLRCGNTSITLTRAGKVLIRGKFVLTDASGVNRIRGGSVQIN
jgi:hypothetical protein